MADHRAGVPSTGVVLGAIAAYNLLQNELLPDRAYVPANLVFTGALVVYARRSGATAAQLGLDPRRVPAGILWGGVTAAVVAAAAGVAPARLRDPWFLDERARGHGTPGAIYRGAIRYPIGTALFEEVAFRGVLDGLLRGSEVRGQPVR